MRACGITLEEGRDDHCRDAVAHIVERQQQIPCHQEIQPPGRQHRPVVDLRAARLDFDIEPVAFIGAVHQCLVEPAMTALGQPVGAHDDLVVRPCRSGGQYGADQSQSACQSCC